MLPWWWTEIPAFVFSCEASYPDQFAPTSIHRIPKADMMSSGPSMFECHGNPRSRRMALPLLRWAGKAVDPRPYMSDLIGVSFGCAPHGVASLPRSSGEKSLVAVLTIPLSLPSATTEFRDAHCPDDGLGLLWRQGLSVFIQWPGSPALSAEHGRQWERLPGSRCRV